MSTRRVDRVGARDLVQLATDVGPVPMNVGAVLMLAPGGDPTAIARTLRARAGDVRRLGQRLVPAPRGLGRPYWVQDPAGVDDLVDVVDCPGRADLAAVTDVAVTAVTDPLDTTRPLWRALVVQDARSSAVAVVLVMHHVLADGLGGLAVLARLVDDAAPRALPTPRPAPTTGDLVADVALAPLRAAAHAGRAVRRLGGSLATHSGRLTAPSGGAHRAGTAPRCSLNVPTGPRRRVAAVDIALAPVRTAARAQGATVNDALVVAATGAMSTLLRERGEVVTDLVVSMPVSGRPPTTAEDLGNVVDVVPVRVPTAGSARERLTAVTAATRRAKGAARSGAPALLGPVFRLLATAGLFQWFIDHQRVVNTFVTNLRGPTDEVSVAGVTITRVIPVTQIAGNVAVAFAAISYAGTLTTTVTADPDALPEPSRLTAAFEAEMQALVSRPSR